MKKRKNNVVKIEIENIIPDVEWSTQKRFIKDLIPHPKNPRMLSKLSREGLVRSLQKYNYVELAAINLDNMILAGHQRIHVMQEIGWGDKEIEVRVPSRMLKQKECDNYLIVSNKVTGDWDHEIMANKWEMQDLLDGGFTESELVGDYNVDLEDINEDEEGEIAEPGEKAITLLGDTYEMNGHRLVCGSSCDPQVKEALFLSKKCDLIITDPPYNVNYTGKTKDALVIENDSMDDASFYTFLLDAYKTMFSAANNGCAIYVFHADAEGVNFRKAFKDAGWKLSGCLVWIKNTFVVGRKDYHWMHEPVLYGWKEGASHNWYGDRAQTTVLSFDRPQRNAEHPTMKPLPILMYLIQNSSKRKQIVFDPFLGSGSTLIACEQTDRICYGVELSPQYCDVIVERFKNYMEKHNKVFEIKRNGQLIFSS